MRKLSGASPSDASAQSAGSDAAGHHVRLSATERRATFGDATVELKSGVREAVAVKNLSVDGARIEFSHTFSLPDHVVLSAPGLGLRRHAQVVWRDERSAGLKFEAE